MALLFCDGFDSGGVEGDLLVASGVTGWKTIDDIAVFSGSVRAGGSGTSIGLISSSDNLVCDVVETPQTIIVGVAFIFTGLSATNNTPFVLIGESGSSHLYVAVNPDGGLDVFVNGVNNDADCAFVSLNVWYYLEIELYVHQTLGTYEVQLNGTIISEEITGMDTQRGSNAWSDFVKINGPVGGSAYFDDFYVLDNSTSYNNSILGAPFVQHLPVNADGATTDFTSGGGANYTNVDETDPDEATTENSGSTITDKDLYGHAALTGTVNTVYAVMQVAMVMKSDAAARTIQFRMDDSVNAEAGDAGGHALPTVYALMTSVWDRNTDGTTAWTETTVNAIEAGIEIDG